MRTTELNLSVPEEILYTLNETKTDFIQKMKFYTAIELYKSQKLSMGKAAELAEMNKVDFMLELGKYDISVINYDEEDFKEEIERILKKWL